MLEITASYPAGPIGDTARNLREAAAGEHEEWSDMYLEFARVAQEEGFPRIASHFKLVAQVEQGHEARYLKLLERVESESVFRDAEEEEWQCRYCGYIHKGKSAPGKCPVCGKEQGYFERKKNNY